MEAEQRPGLSVGVPAATGWPEEAAVEAERAVPRWAGE